MLSSKNRLEKKTIIITIKQGKSYFSDNFKLKTLPINQSNSKFAFIIRSGVVKKAVERNKIKRIMRNITKKYLLFPEKRKEKFNIVVFLTNKIKNKTGKEIEEELISLYKKSKIL